ncbi:glycoside hydrolase family 71 protein [Schizophyllum commune Tattone D]|nr:glycoside hydrolase family 71 protein [Schizophyllum commune Tattone D]
MLNRFSSILTGVAAISGALAAPSPAYSGDHANVTTSEIEGRADPGQKLVFAHFVVGIVSNRGSADDWDKDFQMAKAAGIDGFALNIGVDDFTDTQLNYAYDSAARNGMKAFISFDFNWYHTDQGEQVGQKINQYADRDAQLKIGDKVFASSFIGEGVNSQAIRNSAGHDIFWIPNFWSTTDVSQVDGLFNWVAWPNNGNNKAPTSSADLHTVVGNDDAYRNALGGKPFMARELPITDELLQTHFGPEVSYSKNWVFPSDMLIYLRWLEILANPPQYLELVTWNDYGESHYIGPLSTRHTDDGGSKWANDMPHTGWLDLSAPFIAAYKDGSNDVATHIAEDKIIYWYRATPKNINCDATDTTEADANNSTGNYFKGRPDGWDTLADDVFVVALLTSPGTVRVNTGGTAYDFAAPAGASGFSVPFNTGAQAFSLYRGDPNSPSLHAVSLKQIVNECPCGIYNFNAYVGTVPEQPADQLDGDGLAQFSTGLKVQCQSNTLGNVPAEPAITATMAASAVATQPPIRR